MGVRPNMASDPQRSPDGLARRLAERRDQLEQQLASIVSDAASVTEGGIGFGKRIGEGTNIAVERLSAVAVHEGLLAELEAVRHAEEKLADGSAGRCEICGAQIPPERLEAIPWAVRCVACAASA
jgi:RNA polymerase-binding transcription factor DksA